MSRARVAFLLLTTLGVVACGGTQDNSSAPVPAPAASAQSLTPAEPVAAEPEVPAYDAVPLIPREVLFGNPSKVAPKLSPDGKRLAYVAPDNGTLNIWVQTVGKQDAQAVTHDAHRGISRYFWAPNGKQLLYIQDNDGDENFHVWSVPAEGGESKDLTPIKGVKAEILAVEHDQPNKILIGLNERDPMVHDVYSLDLRTGKTKLVQTNDLTAVTWIIDHKLRVRGAVTFKPDGGGVVLHRPGAKGKLAPLLEWSAEDTFTTGPAGFSKDNRTLYMFTTIGGNTTQLLAIDTKTKKQTVVVGDQWADISGMMTHPTSHKIEAVSFQRARNEWKVMDPSIAKDMEALAKADDGDLKVVSRDRADKTWLVAYDHADGPVVYYTYDRKSRTATRMFSHRPELEDLQLAEMRPVTWIARDGLAIHGYLTLPPEVEAKALPTVIYPHGGPWFRDTWRFEPAAQWLANRGYAVLQPNFRGSTGYGKEFLNAADKEWGGAMQDDITDGTRWLIEQGLADPKRICIMGGSYGGYATLMGLVREPELYACGVDIVGVANLFTWMNTIPPYWMPFQHILHQRVGDPEKDKALLQERSPIFHVDRIQSPLMIGQGANDPRVPKAESIQIRDALQKAGKTVVYLEFADEGHGFAKPENRLKFFSAAEKFLADHLGGRVEH